MSKSIKFLLPILILALVGLSAFILTTSPHSYKKFTTDYYDTNPLTNQDPTDINRPIELVENDSKLYQQEYHPPEKAYPPQEL